MWTRFNIAEPSIHKTSERFEKEWKEVKAHLKSIDAEKRAEELGWDYEEKFGDQEDVFNAWLADFDKWTKSCYDSKGEPPSGRVLDPKDSETCKHGLPMQRVMDGVKDATSMWENFAEKLVE